MSDFDRPDYEPGRARVPTTPRPLWTVEDVMTYLRRGRSWVYDQVAEGGLPHLRVGGLRFVPAEVEAWALRQRGGSTVVPLRYSSSNGAT